MKVSTTSFLLASLCGSAWAAPVSGDLVGSALKPVTSTGGPENVVPGNVTPVDDVIKGLTGAVGQPGSVVGQPGSVVGQPGSVVGRDAPIGGGLVGGALESLTSTGGLGNVAGGNAAPGNIAPVKALTDSLTGAVGQPGGIVGRDGEEKASAVLPGYTLAATGHTADVDIRADAPNVEARNMDAHLESAVGQLVENHDHTELHPFTPDNSPVNVKTNVVANAVTKGN